MPVPRLAAVIEVGPGPIGEVPVDLVRAAYCASRRGTVVLVLNGVSSAQVDRALDPVVQQARGVQGVVYCSPAALELLLRQSGRPRVASVGTRALVAPLTRRGVRLLPRNSVLRALGRLGRGVGRGTSGMRSV
jgi:hypothetical protein